MQINRIDNTRFGQINTKKAEAALFYRLKTPERLIKFEHITHAIDKNPLAVVINEGSHRCLEATIFDETGNVLCKNKEGKLRGIFNLNPNKFMKKILKTVSEITQTTNNVK